MSNRHSVAGEPQARAAAAPDAWQATRAQTALATQFLGDEDAYLATGKPDVGRLTGTDVRELFVSCAPEEALQQQFEHLLPDFIAVHDIATRSSKKLLVGIAAASGRSMQKLIIRRQGYGTPLASLDFLELPTADGAALRMYSTEAEADSTARTALAKTLLGYSRLGVVMVGDLPPHATEAALQPIREAMLGGRWTNRQLLLLPLASAGTLVSHGIDLAQGTGVSVRTTPQVTRPADAWGFITGTWSRLGGEPQTDGRDVPRLGNPNVGKSPGAASPAADVRRVEAGRPPSVAPMDRSAMRPMPALPSAQSRTAPPPADLLERYVQQLVELPGMVSCCVFDIASGREHAHAGAGPSASSLALHGSQLLAAMSNASRSLGFGHVLPDTAITLGSHHLLLRAVPGHPGLALHAVLDKTHANLTLARLQVLRMDALFDA